MKQDIELVVRVQRLDLRAAELEKEIASLPRHLAEIERALEAHTRKLEADKAAVVANQKQRRAIEGEIQMQQQKISKLKDQMMSAKTNEQYHAFQHEIQFCEEAIRKHEDRLLELMLEAEALETNVKSAEAALDGEARHVEEEKIRAKQRSEQDRNELEGLRAERRELVGRIDPKLMALYEKCRKKYHGVAVSEATEGRCSACQLDIRPAIYQELRRGEAVLTCENCGRILYYNPPVAFDTDIRPRSPAEHGTRVDMT
jgi:predicted  nucleic acid-binding Zn-ribbon protein